MNFETVIGLEVHAQLATRSKLFCPCPTDSFGRTANRFICPVCTGQPGVLPVLNRQAVLLAVRAALSLNARIHPVSVFARKNYFYPDLPKSYQISQYEHPLSEHGTMEVKSDGKIKRIRIRRIHLEEDAGKLLHAVGSRKLDYSLVDFNRSGIPLIEIVSEPDISNPEEAFQYLNALKAVLRSIGVSRCDMEKGEMRCDANISLRPENSPENTLGVKTEIKNLNSFKAVKESLAYETERQAEILNSNGRLAQETRLWDAQRGVTQPMRSKEEAHDYRYFPDPDLAPLTISDDEVEEIRKNLGELPAARSGRFQSQYQLSAYDAQVLVSEKSLADYFEEALSSANGRSLSPKPAANWILNELMGKLNEAKLSIGESPVSPRDLADFLAKIQEGTLPSAAAKALFEKAFREGKSLSELLAEPGTLQSSDPAALSEWVEASIRENPKAVEDFLTGKEAALGALVGAVMKKAGGKAGPKTVQQMLRSKLQKKDIP